jgi:hypothetical protein
MRLELTNHKGNGFLVRVVISRPPPSPLGDPGLAEFQNVFDLILPS